MVLDTGSLHERPANSLALASKYLVHSRSCERIWSFRTMTRNLVRYFLTAGLAFLVLTSQADLALA